MALVTLPEVLTYLGQTTDPAGFLADALVKVSAAVSKHCTRTLGSAPSRTEDLDGGVVKLVVRHLPIVAVTSITDRETAEAVTDFVADKDAGLLELADEPAGLPTGAKWDGGARRFRVVYTAGYATVPDDVKLACLEWIAGVWARRNPGVTSTSMGGASSSFEAGMPKAIAAKLSRYRDLIL